MGRGIVLSVLIGFVVLGLFGFDDTFAETLIVASSEADPSHFSKVNTATGEGIQFLGNSGLGFSGIDFSSDEKLYAASAGNLGSEEIPGLYELDGGSVVIPSLVAPGFACSDISFSPNGLLYCISNGDSYFPGRSLVSYNFNTGVSTLIGIPAFETNSNGNAIAVDSGGLIYFGNDDGLYTLNPVNAAPTLVGEWTAHEDNDDCLRFNQPGTFRGQTTGMAFDSSGDLYASFQCGFDPYLGKIDISNELPLVTVTILGPLHSDDPVYQASPFRLGDMKTSALVFAPSDFDSQIGLYPGNDDNLPSDFNFQVGSTFGTVEITDTDVTVNVKPNEDGGVTVDLCGISSLSFGEGGGIFNAACGSVTIQVVSGTVEVEFEADDGSVATTTLIAGDDVFFDEDEFSITNNGESEVVIKVDGGDDITIPAGETIFPMSFVSIWDSSLFFDPLNGIYPVAGSGQINGEFIVDIFDDGNSAIEVGLRAQERFAGPTLDRIDNQYFAPVGTSDILGNALWNYDFHLDFGTTYLADKLDDTLTPLTMADFDVLLELDIDPSSETSFVATDLNMLGIDPVRLVQFSQNMNFESFGGGPDVFDAEIPGIYDIILTVSDEGEVLTSSNIQVIVFDNSVPPTIPNEHYLSYKAKLPKDADKFEKFPVTLDDQFESASYTVDKIERLYNPVQKWHNEDTAEIVDEISHFVGYKIKTPKDADKFETIEDVSVTNQFGDITVDVKKPKLLLVPSAKDHFGEPEELDLVLVDHYKCYDAKVPKDSPKFEKLIVSLYDPNFGITQDFEVKKPKHLCTPVTKILEDGTATTHENPENLLMCYDVKKMKGADKFEKRNVFTNNQFGPEYLKVEKQEELCLPSQILDVPVIE